MYMKDFIENLQFKLGGWYFALIIALTFAILGIPTWIYFGLGMPDDKFWLVIISLVLFGILGALVIFLIVYQTITNSDISKAPWFIKLFGKW